MVGLVLEGGAMRAIYVAGVLDVLMEHDLWPDGLIGVSAGAIHGSVYLGNQPGRTIRYYKRFCRHPRFMSFWSLLTTGSLVGTRFCYRTLPERLDPFDYETFRTCGIPYYAVCTDLQSGKAVYRRCTDLRKEMDFLRASASMPYVSRPVKADGMRLLDGGVVDSIPLAAFRSMGYDRNVVVLTRCKGYQKKPQNPKAAKLFYKKYPRFVQAIAARHEVYNASLRLVEELEAAGEILVLRPSEDLGIKRMEKDPARLQAQYELGRRDAEKQLHAIRAFMEK